MDLPPEVWVAIARFLPLTERYGYACVIYKFPGVIAPVSVAVHTAALAAHRHLSAALLPLPCRLQLALVCKQLYHATRIEGASLWRALPVAFTGTAALRSFRSWRERCICSPAVLMLQQREGPHMGVEEEVEPAEWVDVVEAFRCVAPSITSLMIRYEGTIVAGGHIRCRTRPFCGPMLGADGHAACSTRAVLNADAAHGSTSGADALAGCLPALGTRAGWLSQAVAAARNASFGMPPPGGTPLQGSGCGRRISCKIWPCMHIGWC
jgi:hypothetical protein